jgi:hypothetical protein
MSAQLHRVALWLRLLLVCLVLTGVSASARTMGYREAVVAVATATTRAPEERKATPAPSTARGARETPMAAASWSSPLTAPIAQRRSPAPPRRLFLINSALLC